MTSGTEIRIGGCIPAMRKSMQKAVSFYGVGSKSRLFFGPWFLVLILVGFLPIAYGEFPHAYAEEIGLYPHNIGIHLDHDVNKSPEDFPYPEIVSDERFAMSGVRDMEHYKDENGNEYYYVSSRSDGLVQIVDVTDPHNLRNVGTFGYLPNELFLPDRISINKNCLVLNSYEIAGHLHWETNDDALFTFDISNPEDPAFVDRFEILEVYDHSIIETDSGTYIYALANTESSTGSTPANVDKMVLRFLLNDDCSLDYVDSITDNHTTIMNYPNRVFAVNIDTPRHHETDQEFYLVVSASSSQNLEWNPAINGYEFACGINIFDITDTSVFPQLPIVTFHEFNTGWMDRCPNPRGMELKQFEEPDGTVRTVLLLSASSWVVGLDLADPENPSLLFKIDNSVSVDHDLDPSTALRNYSSSSSSNFEIFEINNERYLGIQRMNTGLTAMPIYEYGNYTRPVLVNVGLYPYGNDYWDWSMPFRLAYTSDIIQSGNHTYGFSIGRDGNGGMLVSQFTDYPRDSHIVQGSHDHNWNSGYNQEDDQWWKAPTFGLNHYDHRPYVGCGVIWDGTCIDVTDNWHTSLDPLETVTGRNHTVTLKAFFHDPTMPNIWEFALVPEIGRLHDPEASVVLKMYDGHDRLLEPKIASVEVFQDEQVIEEKFLDAEFGTEPCGIIDSDCQYVTISNIFFKEDYVSGKIAVQAINDRRQNVITYLNDGLDVSGDSLNPPITMSFLKKDRSQDKPEPVTLTRIHQYNSTWADENGHRYHVNDHRTVVRIDHPEPEGRQDPISTAMTRLNSNFEKIIQYERNRAAEIFDSTEYQNSLPGSIPTLISKAQDIADTLSLEREAARITEKFDEKNPVSYKDIYQNHNATE